MFRTVCMVVILATLMAGTVLAESYNYVKPETMKTWLETKKPVIVVDIQVPAEFAKRHLPGSVETNAFPVKSDEEKKRLENVLATIGSSRDDVVIVCPRGGGGAKNTYEYLKSKGVDEKRMYILEKGIEGWPYPQMCATGR
ncbi:rhodanese-like domain-containing protein [Geobacter sp. SVR]|uniref:rhodanese-like domain-containing protein n=1 Tax=Geobacter sp. SVR TaxID=2495594 RepID=UPI00143EFAE2|nr:rhodanese-like domain-containing protein [Geobacter sp. SVR]BCS53873.1 hypothetical protein GSVR_21810 [Geobacter sp. SVR]GCF85618.1 hypothetical protein GSbR_22180 [Geobacter sp. SVR]